MEAAFMCLPHTGESSFNVFAYHRGLCEVSAVHDADDAELEVLGSIMTLIECTVGLPSTPPVSPRTSLLPRTRNLARG